MANMDNIDKALLDLIQSNFPVASRPYAVLAEKTGISEKEAFERVMNLKKEKIIRRIGANFQSSKLGFVSTLCAAKVPVEQLESFSERVNAEPGVTHNYERDHAYNIWFTVIAPSREKISEILDKIKADTGVEILNLPATKLLKIKVDFPVSDG